MTDLFDIDSSSHINYHSRDEVDTFKQNQSRWNSSEAKDPRLSSRKESRTSLERSHIPTYDKLGVAVSPVRKHYSHSPSPKRHVGRRSSEGNGLSPDKGSSDRDNWKSPQRGQKLSQMYSQPPQTYQQPPPPPPIYSHEQYNTSGYPPSMPSYPSGYRHPAYGQPPLPPGTSFSQYNTSTGYPPQTYVSAQPGPPGEEYPGSWAPAQTGYPNMSHHAPPVARPPSGPHDQPGLDTKDNKKKEAAIANEMKQQQATLIKQRDEYLRKASVLRRELEKLRLQKHELLAEKSPPRDSHRILRENGKLQIEIQEKLKSINNVVDMLSGIIGDNLQNKDDDTKTNSSSNSPKHLNQRSRTGSLEEDEAQKRAGSDMPCFNYIHYDPELHWCRVCDVFPRSAKEFLNHLQSAEHRQVTQEHHLVDTPWHKLPDDEELPSYKGAPVKRVPIKGLQFFISTTAWYCKLCDTWIGDLHCASLHLKSKNHAHNYSNFVEQNPHWEMNWLKDREKAFERCGKLNLNSDEDGIPPAPDPPLINDKKKGRKGRDKQDSPFLELSKDKKKKKKSKKRKKMESSGSSSSSSSSDSSSEEDSDRSKSIRVAMRNKMRMQAQLILKEEMEGKLEALGRLVEEDRKRQKDQVQQDAHMEDNIINQWMTVNNTPTNEKYMLEGLKGRMKQRQEADKAKAEQAAAEKRRREREREEKELKEIREREKRELEEKIRQEQKEEREREERERIKERERRRRRDRSDSDSPDRFRGRSRSKSIDRKTSRSHGRGRSQDRQYHRGDKRYDRQSPTPDKYRSKRSNFDDDRGFYEANFEKQAAESMKKEKKPVIIGPRKLPFIGRMPLFKKKGEEEKEIKKEDYDIRPTKFEPVSSARPFIPAPGVVHITKLATPPDPIQMIKINAENPPPPPQIIPEPPKISEPEEMAPPPPIITPDVQEDPEDDDDELEMEAGQAGPPLPPCITDSQTKSMTKPAGEHLPRDFQEALNIIFPGDQRPDQMAIAQDPNMMMQYQYGMGYGMMYPGMQIYEYGHEMPPELQDKPLDTEKPAPPANHDDDLAMLGIDAEDMAAQTI